METLSIILSVIFLMLALLHFYWALGGEWGFANALPVKENGQRIINPGKTASSIVGFGLLIFSAFYLILPGILFISIPGLILNIMAWIIPAIFTGRAIGDFKFVGFFKKVKQTPFAKLDTKIYSPLCLSLGIAGIIIELLR